MTRNYKENKPIDAEAIFGEKDATGQRLGLRRPLLTKSAI
jgi:hypothetical protein